jgi:hypothetical protein
MNPFRIFCCIVFGLLFQNTQAQTIQVIAPNGGEILPVGSQGLIQWNQSGLSNIQIEYSTNNGSSWIAVINSFPAIVGEYSWTVPATLSTQAKVRITDLLNPLITDVSNSPFMIQDVNPDKHRGGSRDGAVWNFNISNSISLLSFNQGGTFPPGTQQFISWSANVSEFVDIDWSSDNGSSWTSLGNTLPVSSGQIPWTIPNQLGLTNFIRIRDSYNPGIYFTQSAIPFSILEEDPSKHKGGDYDGHTLNSNLGNEIVLVSPQGGEFYAVNSVINLEWSANQAANVLLEYSSNNGSSWQNISSPLSGNLTSFVWTLPSAPSAQMRVRISDAANQNTSFDESNSFALVDLNSVKHRGGSFDGAVVNENQPNSVVLTYPNGGEIIYPGLGVNILWTSINVSDVTLEYSTNNGTNWVQIATGVPAVTSSFSWTVPAIQAIGSALVRIQETGSPSVRDTSNAGFTVMQESTQKFTGGNYDGHVLNTNAANALQILSPLGGEVFAESSTQLILWNANNIDFVRIEYSTNNGSQWNLITASHPANLGFYSWNIPPQVTTQAKVRVLDLVNQQTVFSQSPQVFTLSGNDPVKFVGGAFDGTSLNVNQPPSITVISPIGTDIWYEGQSVGIAWTSVNVPDVNIEISTNNGSSWAIIASGEPASLGQYVWSVTGFPGQGSVRVKVSSASNPLVFGISSASHTISFYTVEKNKGGEGDGTSLNTNLGNAIQVVSPNGGEVYAEASTQQIRWNANNINNVRLEYSTNNGTSWVLISANYQANLGVYDWSVPMIQTSSALIRVSDILNQSTVFDISNASFSIFSTDPNKHFGGNGDGYSMNVNQPPSLTVLSPNGGETWYQGQTINISWNSINVSDVSIEISTNSGSSWNILSASEPAVVNSYLWTVNGYFAQGNTLIRIVDLSNSLVRDSSNSGFTIPLEYSQKFTGGDYDGHSKGINENRALQVISPNGGESFAQSSTQLIQWNANDISNVRLEFSSNNGSSWNLISANESGNLVGYNWQMPQIISNQMLVRVLDVLNPSTVRDTSNNTFSIQAEVSDKYLGGMADGYSMNVNAPPSITVTSPSTALTWYEGQVVTITWNSVNVSDVSIEISSNNGSSWTVLDNSEPAVLSSFIWVVTGFSANATAFIRVKDTGNPAIFDDSNVPVTIPHYASEKNTGGSQDGFTLGINQANAIILNSPNGGEVFADNSTQQIQWSANNISNVRLEYSTNNGSSWVLISANETANLGSYNWLIPSVNSLTARVRVSDVLNTSTVLDVSNNAFTIATVLADKYEGGSYDGHALNVNQAPAITILSPNTGAEVFYEGQILPITWSSVNVTALSIEISSNNGSSWTLLSASEQAVAGAYNWTVSGQGGISTVLVRLTDTSNPLVTDVNNTPFSIPSYFVDKNRGGESDGFASEVSVANNLLVISPNGGESFPEGSVQNITWVANGINNVRIEYSTNSGSSWLLVNASVTGSLGSFSWTIPSTPSRFVLVRILDVLNPLTYLDTSSTIFSITSPVMEKFWGGSYDGFSYGTNGGGQITVTQPNGGEIWLGGNANTIAWTYLNVTQVNIEGSSNNGSSWFTIVSNLPAQNLTHSWLAPPSIGGPQFLVRVSDAGNGSVNDVSNANFTLNLLYNEKYSGGSFDGFSREHYPGGTITLTSPNTAISIQPNTLFPITWTQTVPGDVGVEYSTNNGSSWNTVVSSVPGSPSTYSWLVPNTPTTSALVKVYSANAPSVFDVSDVAFEISVFSEEKYRGGTFDGVSVGTNLTPSLSLIYPNGGEILIPGNFVSIQWAQVALSSVGLEWSSDNGSNWNLITANVAAQSGSFTWLVPNSFTNQALVRVFDSFNPLLEDFSDAVFTLPFEALGKHSGGLGRGDIMNPASASNLVLVYPDQFENFAAGAVVSVQWTTNSIAQVNLDYSTNNGSSWINISTGVTAGLNSFSWTIPAVSTQTGRVRVSDLNNPGTVFDVSSSAFVISNPTALKYIGGSFDGTAMDVNQAPAVSLLTPNGGEVWYPGGDYPITWSSVSVLNVSLDYSLDNGSSWTQIVTNIPTVLGTYLWNVPSISSQSALIRVRDASNPLVSDVSNSGFIVPNQAGVKFSGGAGDGYTMDLNASNTLVLLSPNGGESIAAGATVSLLWTSNNLATLMLEYSTNAGSSWQAIVVGTPANLEQYSWLVPSVNTQNALIRLTDLVNPGQYWDVSNQVFRISNPMVEKHWGGAYDGHSVSVNQVPSLTVLAPNGGEQLYPGSPVQVNWVAVNVLEVNIEYSTNNGSAWVMIVSQEPAPAGSYLWNVPSNIAGVNSLIRITDSGNSSIRDTSNASFVILHESTQKFRGGSGDGAGMDFPLSSALTLIAPNGGESLAAGSTFSIQWTANGLHNVILEFSTNAGSSWTAITVNAPANTGNFSWVVPNLTTQNALIRVSDLVSPGVYTDVSNAVFNILGPNPDKYLGGAYDGHSMNINQVPAITLLTPNGGESYLPNNQHLITWNSVNVVNVDLEFSTNNGTSWVVISTQEPAALGQFVWTIPGLSSNQVLVRIKDSSNPILLDVSNAFFQIPFEASIKYRGGASDGYALAVNAANSLQLLGPNGGESFAENQQYTIQWIANNLIDVILEYSSNQGSSWQAIVPAVAANTGVFQWAVPGVSTQQALVRVSDLIDPGTYQDVSDAVFTINSPNGAKYTGGSYDGNIMAENQVPSIAIIKPNGGEYIVPGFQYEINWTSVNVSQAIVEYSANNGSSWNLIASPVPATSGSFTWNVPSVNSTQVLVRISDFMIPSISDTSNAVFVIPNQVDGKFRGGAGDGSIVGINAANALFVLSPNGGENFADGISTSITFIANALDNVMIEFSSNQGSSWSLVSGSTPGNLGVFNWTTPAINTNTGLIRISDLVNPQVYVDLSNAVFTINSLDPSKFLGGTGDGYAMSQNQPPSVVVINPNGGQIIYPGSTISIDWNSVNLTTVNLYYSTDNGSVWTSIDTQVPAVQGSYGWFVPNIHGLNVLVKVEEDGNPALFDVSDAIFSIPNQVVGKYQGGSGSGHEMDVNQNRMIVVVAPNGGEQLAGGSTQMVQWAANTINAVNIEWSSDNGINWNLLVQNYPGNTGAYPWLVGNTVSTTNLIRVSDAVFTTTRRDTSNAVFAISGPVADKYFGGGYDGQALNTNQSPSISLVIPNGGEIWNSQTTQLITWSQVNVALVNLEYSIDNGSNWVLIQSNAPGSAGQFSWLIPNNGSQQSLVRIVDSSNGLVRDSSDAVFNIPNLVAEKYSGGSFDGVSVDENVPPSLVLTSPNGGEQWYSGSSQSIQWTSANVSSVSLQYSTDNGSNWNAITPATSAGIGSFNWLVPNVAGNQMLVRIIDISSGVLMDTSNTVFEIPHLTAFKYRGGSYDGHGSAINPGNAIVLIEPKGGEIYPVMTPQNIIWAANSISAVNIEYSEDNGSSWFTLSTAQPGQMFQYPWSAPGPATQIGLVRISQTGNNTVQAVSNTNFATVDGLANKFFGGSYDGFGYGSNAGSSITLLNPNGSEVWYEGSTQSITWQQTDVTLLNLDVSTNNGSSWTNLVSNISAPVGSYSWMVSGPGSQQALVRAVNALDTQVRDSSNANFSIPLQEGIKYNGGGLDGFASSANIPPTISLTAPNGGETILPGSFHPITWTSTNISTVGIEYSSDNGSNWSSIVNGVSAQTGIYHWLTPSQGTQIALIRIFSNQSPSVNDTSNSAFTLLHEALGKYTGGGFDGAVMAVNVTTATLTGVDTVCVGSSINLAFQLTGAAPWTLTYTNGTTPQTISGITQTPYQVVVTPASTSTYTIQSVTGSSGAGVGVGSASVLVRNIPNAQYSSNQTICIGASTQLSVNLSGVSPWSLTWTDGTTPTVVSGLTSSLYVIPITPVAQTTYSFVSLQDLYCSNLSMNSTSIVQTEAIPSATITGNSTICVGSSTQFSILLTGSQPWTVAWTDGTTLTSASGLTSSPYVVNLTPSTTTTYFPASVSNQFCSGNVSGLISMQVESIPQASLSGAQSICLGCTASMTTSLSGAMPWDLTWTDGTTQTTISGLTSSPYIFVTTPAADVTYSLVSVLSPYCSGTVSGSAPITVIPYPTAALSGSQTVCLGNSAQVSIALTGLSPWQVVYTDGTQQFTLSGLTQSPYLLITTPTASVTYSLVSIEDVNQTPGTISGQAALDVYIPAAVPVAISPGNINCTSILARWNAAQNATAYRFDLALDAGFTSFVSGYNDLNLTDTFLNIPGLNVSTQYFYRVRAIGGCGATISSNTISLTTLPNTWTGLGVNNSDDWQDPANWCSGVPTAIGSALVPAGPSHMPSIASNTVVGELTIGSGASVSLSGQPVLSVRRNWYNSGSFNPDTGTVQFTGIVPQLISGIDTFFHYRVDNTAGVTIASGSGNNQVILGVYTPVAGSLLTNGNLVIASTPTRTGSIAKEIAPTATTIGNIVYERSIPLTGWHYIGIPTTNAHSSQLVGQVNVGSIYWYHEPTFGPRNSGLLQLGLDSMPVEYGYYLQTTTANAKFAVTGPAQEGTVVYPISWTVDPNNRSASGWNLLSNPYPSTIDWASALGWNSTGVSTTMFVMNPTTNTEASFNKFTGLGTNGGSRYIASGQGFIVKATTSNPTLLVTEDIKSPQPRPFFRSNDKENLLSLHLKDGVRSYETLVYFEKDRLKGLDEFEDSELPPSAIWNPHLKAGTINSDGALLAINAMPEIGTNDTFRIPVFMEHTGDGNYEWVFGNRESFESGVQVHLEDHFTGTKTNIFENSSYSWDIDTRKPGTYHERFSLVAYRSHLPTSDLSSKLDLQVYPNPSDNQEVTVLLTGLSGKDRAVSIKVMDVLGRVILVRSIEKDLDGTGSMVLIPGKDLPAGLFTIQAIYGGVSSVEKLIIR